MTLDFVVWRNLTPRKFLAFWLIIVAAVKAILLRLDPMPALFMGDSGAYLTTAYAQYIPTERSFVYGLFLRLIAYRPHSLHTVVLFQTILSALSAWIVAVILVRYVKTGFAVAALCSLVCAIEPLQLMSERYILTEALSTFLFALLVITAFRYLSTSRVLWLGLVQVIGALLITIRISFLPIVLFASFALPLLTQHTITLLRSHQWKLLGRQVIAPILFSLVLSQSLLLGYKDFYGSLFVPQQDGAFLYGDGLFLASDLAPLIRSSDYPIAEQRDAIFSNLKHPLSNRRVREAQRWYDGDLCVLIIKASGGDLFKANKLARKTALRAAKRDPLGVLRLAASTFVDYFDSDYLNEATLTDEGRGQGISAELIQDLKYYFRADFTQSYVDSFTKWWHRQCQIWYLFLLLLPLLFLLHVLVYRRRSTSYHWICAIFALAFLEGAILTTERPIPRYLTAAAWLGCIIVGAVLADIRNVYLRTPNVSRHRESVLSHS
jgi:hypothetical protein